MTLQRWSIGTIYEGSTINYSDNAQIQIIPPCLIKQNFEISKCLLKRFILTPWVVFENFLKMSVVKLKKKFTQLVSTSNGGFIRRDEDWPEEGCYLWGRGAWHLMRSKMLNCEVKTSLLALRLSDQWSVSCKGVKGLLQLSPKCYQTCTHLCGVEIDERNDIT